MKHLLLYDETCPLCNRSVHIILKRDKKKKFLFSPLQGKTAEKVLKKLPPDLDTLILVENFESNKEHILMEGKGALRICFHLGGIYFPLGLLSFLPTFAFDAFYRFIAKRRYRLFSMGKELKESDFKGRFLP